MKTESPQSSPVETPVRSAVEELSEKEFCRMYTQYHGEEINNIRQLVCASFSGEELMEFVQHCLKSRPSVVGENESKLTPIEPLKEEWISVDERLPESNIWVLCIGATGPSFVGKYTKGHEIEYWDDDYDGPYDEVEDKAGTLYLKPGWYELEEQNHHDYDEMWMSRIVTHWMPLPSPPKV